MKKLLYLSVFVAVGLLLAGAMPSFAQTKTEQTSGPDVDGFVWLMSSDAEKKSFLFGAGSAVAMEYHVRAIRKEEPSKFIKGWTEALKDVSWSELASEVDAYYDSNPDRKDKLVFEVIWQTIITPRLNK
ncbi:hypothetical protein [Pseudodesulfovibrio pelocollis]|uniref:hypothetical protein n=1 Tax=Pseudodesulfovibrio pelocollis TaxID=3051432 RepID=UPI00255B2207|nr:hypothetical protein [Pseudodesulfovibrio sp. SB368]